jgi:hypothetical protein
MRRAEAGRVTGLGVVTLATDFTFLTVAVTFLGVASALAVRVVEVLRVRVLRVFVGVAVVEDLGIKTKFVCLLF